MNEVLGEFYIGMMPVFILLIAWWCLNVPKKVCLNLGIFWNCIDVVVSVLVPCLVHQKIPVVLLITHLVVLLILIWLRIPPSQRKRKPKTAAVRKRPPLVGTSFPAPATFNSLALRG